MKRFVLLLMLVIAAGIAGAQGAAKHAAVSGPISNEELQRFRALAPIDTHAHVFAAGPFVAMLQKLNLLILDILVVDRMSPTHRYLETQLSEALSVVHASHGYAVLCTSFDPYSWNEPGYSEKVTRGLNDHFANGAIAV